MSNRQNMFGSNCKMSPKEEHHGIEFKFEIRELNALFSLETYNAFACATESVCIMYDCFFGSFGQL